MTRWLSLALLLGSAAAQETPIEHILRPSPLALRIDFATPGCVASGSVMGSKGETVTVTRSSGKTCPVAAGEQVCTNNQLCVTELGALIEPARTNYALNCATHPKTDEATGSLSTGAAVAWHAGTGTMTLAAGTATVTGLSCTAVEAGTLCGFTVTGAGTMLVTTTAGTTHVQVTNGSYRTSRIDTAGSPVARSADAVSVANPLTDGAQWCADFIAEPEYGRAWTVNANLHRMWRWNTPSSNAAYVSDQNFGVYDSTGTQKFRGYSASPPSSAAHRVQAKALNGELTLLVDGVSTGTPGGTGTGVITTPGATHLIGSDSAGTEFGGFIRSFRLYRKATCR